MSQDEKNQMFEKELRELMLRYGVNKMVVHRGHCSGFNEAGHGLFEFRRVVVDGPDGEIERWSL